MKKLFDIHPAHHHSRPLLVGTVMLALITLALVSAIQHHVPLSPIPGRVMEAQFHDADNVTNRTAVRVNGIQVGRVQDVEPGPNPYATSTVLMRITDPSVHLHTNAYAQVRWRTLLGGLMYVDLHPGSADKPPLDGPILATNTSHQVEFDQLLEAYGGQGAQQQRNLFKGLRDTLADPHGIGRTIDTLSPTLQTVGQGLEPLQGVDTGDLAAAVSATASTLRGLGNSSGLEELVSSAEQTLAVTAAQRSQLGQTLALSPPALQSTFTTMRVLRTTLTHLDPLVAELRPGARELASAAGAATPALHQLETVLTQAHPLLTAAGPTFRALKAASNTGTPLMNALDPTVTRAVRTLIPFLDSRDSGTKLAVYEMIGPFWSDLAAASGGYDAVGYRIRFTAPLGSNSLLMDNPLAGQLKAACAGSLLPRQECGKATTLLKRGWFAGSAKGGRR
jgi:ABC-type transporter Mla subunit MlaD